MKPFIFQILLIVFFFIVESINWLSLLLDELFFASYKKIEIKSPLYISGMPRTASSLMHYLLSQDKERYTTMKLWEIVFAPSIIQKRILIIINNLDCKLSSPLKGIVQYLEKKIFKRFDITHPLSLSNIEEDEYLLIHNFSSALLVFFFPSIFQRMIFKDSVDPYIFRTNEIQFYKNCIKKHLFVFGKNKTYLAKSPAHIIRYSLLIKNFPDLKMIGMLRVPHETIPSTISLFNNFNTIFYSRLDSKMITSKTLQIADLSYQNLLSLNEKNNGTKFTVVEFADFINNPESTIHSLYSKLQYKVSDSFLNKLKSGCSWSSIFKSKHLYSLEKYNLNKEEIINRYDFVYKKFY